MAFNWEIKVASPVLTEGLSFRVRYKKQPNGNWLDFLPNPTTNTFTITGIDEDKYLAEIKTVCSDGTLSTPGYIESPCFGGGGGDEGNPPNVNIYWNDTFNSDDREYDNSFDLPIDFNASDADNDIVLIEGEYSNNGNEWFGLGVVNHNFRVTGNKPNNYFFRVKATDSKNNFAYSNLLTIRYKEIVNPDLQITNIQGVYPPSCNDGGEEMNFEIIGRPNQIVKFKTECTKVVGHNFNFNVTQNGISPSFSWGSVQAGDATESSFILNADGKLICNAKLCLRPCLNESFSQAIVVFTLINDDGSLTNQILNFNGYQDCNE